MRYQEIAYCQASLCLLLETKFKGPGDPMLELRTAVLGGAMKAILFVDDHEVLARLSCEILEMQGYRAVSAYSASQALEKFDQEKFDVLVTDFRMEGMDGLQLARKIHAKDPSLPVIIVTGYGPIETGGDAHACLPKEHLFPALLEKIRLILGENEARKEPKEPAVRSA